MSDERVPVHRQAPTAEDVAVNAVAAMQQASAEAAPALVDVAGAVTPAGASDAPGAATAPVPAEEPRPRRSKKKQAEEPAGTASGYRSSRRSSKGAKKARRAEQQSRLKGAFAGIARKLGQGAASVVVGLVAVVVVAGLVFAAVYGVNAGARWYLKRRATAAAEMAAKQKVRENLLVIAVNGRQATGFVAMRLDRKQSRVFGIAIPDGAFVEVPGQGFERIGDSYKVGPDVSMSAVANYLSVPFDYYVVIDDASYKDMMKRQSVDALMSSVQSTNLAPDVRNEVGAFLLKVQSRNVGLAPLPVRSIAIGSQTYFEPQRDQIADLLFSWWGVRFGSGKQALRLIIYNGAGRPGIAGVAAQQLIRAGYRVVDTGNAQRFDYAKTQIVVFRGDQGDVQRVRDILGAGTIESKAADQNITDVIVIIGKDYQPPAAAR